MGRPSNYAIMVARVQGSISIEKLKMILNQLKLKHPLLNSKIMYDDENNAWLINGKIPEIPLIEKKRAYDEEWVEVLKKEQTHLFPLHEGPLIRFILLRDPNSFDLIINCHHSISDGLSLAYLIDDILNYLAYHGEKINPSIYPPQLNKENLPGKAKRNFGTKIIIKILNSFWKRNKTTFSLEDYCKLNNKYWDINRCGILAWQLSMSETSNFISCCKKEKVTVNSALCAAFLTALNEIKKLNEDSNYKVHIPINIRDRIKKNVGRAFGFYAQTLNLELKYDVYLSFWNLVRKYNSQIHSEMKDETSVFNLFKIELINPSLLDSVYYQKYGLFDNKWSKILLKGMGVNELIANFSITNIGKLEIPADYGNYSLEALYGPSVFSDLIEMVVGVSTVGEKMNLIITYNEKNLSKNQIDNIKKISMGLIKKACD